MRLLVHICYSLLFLLPNLISAQDIKQMSLEEAINYALDHSLELENARLNIEDAEHQVLERRAAGLPQVNGSANYQYYYKVPLVPLPESFDLPPGASRQISFQLKNNLNFGIGMNTLLLDGSYLTALKAARRYKDFAAQEFRTKEKEVKDAVLDAYLPALLIQENLKILDKNITNLERMEKEMSATYDAGFIEQLDVDRVVLSLANLNTEKTNLKRQMELVLNALKFTISYPMEDQLELSDNLETLMKMHEAESLSAEVDYYSRPEYKQAEIGVTLQEINLKYNKTLYYPSLVGQASYQYGYQGDQLFHEDGFWASTGIVGLGLNVPIFDGFDKRSKIDRAEVALNIAQNQKKDLARLIDLQVTNARKQLETAEERLKFQHKNLELAQKIYDTTQIKYREGVGSSIELTQAEQSLYATQQNRIQAMYDVLLAKMELYKALGRS